MASEGRQMNWEEAVAAMEKGYKVTHDDMAAGWYWHIKDNAICTPDDKVNLLKLTNEGLAMRAMSRTDWRVFTGEAKAPGAISAADAKKLLDHRFAIAGLEVTDIPSGEFIVVDKKVLQDKAKKKLADRYIQQDKATTKVRKLIYLDEYFKLIEQVTGVKS